MSTVDQFVLLTGATGHVGFAVLTKALEAGYNVRVVLRDMSRTDKILSSNTIKKALSSDAAPELSFAKVSDMTMPDAFDSVMQDVIYVVHCASPINRGGHQDVQAELIDPAVNGTLNILKAARAVSSVRRVVITSSNSAIVNHHSPPVLGRRISPSDRQPDYPLEVATRGADEAYSAGKTAALNATDTFVLNESNLHFDVVSIMPTYVFGPKDLAESPEDIVNGSNVFGIGLVLIKQSWGSLRIEAVSCHVEDVALVHVRALNHDEDAQFPLQAGVHRCCILAVPFKPEEVREIIEREFPRELWENETAIFGGRGIYEWYHTDYDVTVAQNLLGRKLSPLVEQINSSGLQVLRIARAPKEDI